jgi:spermidine/putrescine ABC transporter ATP-binding subunit
LNITKKFGNTVAVDGLSINVGEGEFLTLLGPSGCGKTTTLRMIAGLVKPDAGRILVRGESVEDKPANKRNMGLVFQNYALFPHMTISENLSYGLEMRKVDKGATRQKVKQALELVKLEGMEERYPRQLSGGQQQRIALARALIIEPDILLLDEPLSNLDFKLRQAMRLEILSIQRKLGITSIYVTHDQTEALVMSTRVAVMHRGKLVQLGTPRDVYDFPADQFVADFIGETNLFVGNVAEIKGNYLMIDVGKGCTLCASQVHAYSDRDGPKPRAEVKVSVRPEKVMLGQIVEANNVFSGTIEKVVYLGSEVKYYIRVDDDKQILVNKQIDPTNRVYNEGEKITVGWFAEDSIVLMN